MKKSIPILIENVDNIDGFVLYPNENGNGVSLSQDEILKVSKEYSIIYEVLISKLSKKYFEHFNISLKIAETVIRNSAVPVMHCFIDRLTRMNKALKMTSFELLTPRVDFRDFPESIDTFNILTLSNPNFNQFLIYLIGKVWGLGECSYIDLAESCPFQEKFINHVFRIYPRSIIPALKNHIAKILSKIPKSRIPVLSMAYASGAFMRYGFFRKYFKGVSVNSIEVIKDHDSYLRDKILSKDIFDFPELKNLFGALGLSEDQKKKAVEVIQSFFKLLFPKSALELFPEFVNKAENELNAFEKKILFVSGGISSKEIYIIAVARERGFSLIDHQHGGHYGYINDMKGLLELEYANIDIFLSWGWCKLPKNVVNKKMNVYPLPSPWLSERIKYLKKNKKIKNKEFDILLMPNMIKRFPPALYGASTGRIDLVKEIGDSLLNLIKVFTDQGIRVLHKPYNQETVNILKNTMKKLRDVGGDNYEVIGKLDKGITHELLEKSHIVLWDQPGTGFLECIVSKIPTLVYWPRIFNHEEEWTKPYFLDLEKSGIVHRKPETIAMEIQQYKNSPEEWMNNIKRTTAIEKFSYKFARTDKNWPKKWREYINRQIRKSSFDNE